MLLTSLLALAVAADPGWPDLSEPPRVGGGSKDAAIIVSIEDYVFVDDIPGAQANGLDWYSYFTDGIGIPPSRVALLENQRATREAIETVITENRGRVGKDGTLWFVFIGHGAPSRDGSDGLLLGADTQPTAASVYARGLPQSALLSELGKGSQSETVVLLDACFSGQSGEGALVDGLMPLVPDYGDHKSDAIVLSAGKGDEFAGPLPGTSRPAFSYLALGALRGWGDADGNGRVTAQEVSDYARGALQAMPLDRKQTPQIHASTPTTVLGQGRESGPSLSKLRRSLSTSTVSGTVEAVTVDGGGSLAAQLAEMRRLQEQQAALAAQQAQLEEQLAREVAARRSAIQSEAHALWVETDQIAAAGGEMKAKALQLFIDAYQDAHVTVENERFDVSVVEVSVAQQQLGDMYRDGTSVGQDYGRAVALYTAACAQDNSIACNNLGYRYKRGQGVTKDLAKAAELLVKSCSLQYASACYGAGTAYRNGEGVSTDARRAVSLFEDGCDLDHNYSCNSLGWYGYRDGNGVGVDYAKAISLFNKACDADYGPSCGNAADLIRQGQGASVDMARAMALYEKGCDLKNAFSCNELGWFGYLKGQGYAQSDTKALTYFLKACEMDSGTGCSNAGDIYRSGGDGVSQSHAEAAELYRKGCDLDNSTACNNLGFRYREGEGVSQDYAEAMRLFTIACDDGSGAGCSNIAALYREGLGVREDQSKAVTYYQKGCDLGNGTGCSWLGYQHNHGQGTPENRAKALDAYKKACELGIESSCQSYENLK